MAAWFASLVHAIDNGVIAPRLAQVLYRVLEESHESDFVNELPTIMRGRPLSMNVYAVLPVHRRVLGGAARFALKGLYAAYHFHTFDTGWTLSELRENVHVPILSTLSSVIIPAISCL